MKLLSTSIVEFNVYFKLLISSNNMLIQICFVLAYYFFL